MTTLLESKLDSLFLIPSCFRVFVIDLDQPSENMTSSRPPDNSTSMRVYPQKAPFPGAL